MEAVCAKFRVMLTVSGDCLSSRCWQSIITQFRKVLAGVLITDSRTIQASLHSGKNGAFMLEILAAIRSRM